ncbi:MAG: hypothetical protein AJITA_00474 [Acetilactobacillus jinshanensis]
MDDLSEFQKSLIDNSIEQVKTVIDNDYSIGKMHNALSSLSEELTILPKYHKYAVSKIHKVAQHYRNLDKEYYKRFNKMNPKFIEVTLNLSNFK